MQYVARKRIDVGRNDFREIGEVVPEVAYWPAHIIRANLSVGNIVAVAQTESVQVKTTTEKPKKAKKTKTAEARCAICDRSFNSERFLSLHMKKEHVD